MFSEHPDWDALEPEEVSKLAECYHLIAAAHEVVRTDDASREIARRLLKAYASGVHNPFDLVRAAQPVKH